MASFRQKFGAWQPWRADQRGAGGKFKHGFFAGMFASMAGSGMEASGWGVFSTTSGQLVTAAVVGGTASELGGGKFANGAVNLFFGICKNWQPLVLICN